MSPCPELAADQLAVRRAASRRERLLVLQRVAAEHLRRRPLHVGDDDVDRALGWRPRCAATASAAVKPDHAAPFGEQVRDQDDRALSSCCSASATPRTRKIGIRLV